MHKLALVVAVLAACDKKPAPRAEDTRAPAPARVRLFTDGEIASLRTGLEQRIAANKARSCKRPVLHGPEAPGPVGTDLLALVEPQGELRDCLTEVTKVEGGAKLVELVKRRAPELVAIVTRCAPALEKLVTTIAAHADACTPYQPGIRVEPEVVLPVLRFGHMLALRVAIKGDAGDAEGALWLAADSIRALQDVARGPTSLILPMVSGGAIKSVLDQVLGVLATTTLDRGAAADLATAFDALLASEQHFGVTMQGELDTMAVQLGLGRLDPASSPAGGSGAGVSPAADLDIDPRDEAALMLAMAERARADVVAACPDTAPYATCWRGLDQLAKQVSARTSPPKDPKALVATLQETAGSADTPEARERARREIQGLVVDILASIAQPTYAEYVGKRARTVAHLAAIRIALEVATSGRCPTEAALDQPPYATLRAPTVLGDQLVTSLVTRGGSKVLELSPPSWANANQESWTIRCP